VGPTCQPAGEREKGGGPAGLFGPAGIEWAERDGWAGVS
jgi:hypothetical protein